MKTRTIVNPHGYIETNGGMAPRKSANHVGKCKFEGVASAGGGGLDRRLLSFRRIWVFLEQSQSVY